MNDFGISGYRPDIVFFIDVPPEVGFSRMTGRKKDRLENEDINFHHQVYNYFTTMAVFANNTVKIDGVNLSPEEEAKIITDKIIKTLNDKL
jgi:dTMP kinase